MGHLREFDLDESWTILKIRTIYNFGLHPIWVAVRPIGYGPTTISSTMVCHRRRLKLYQIYCPELVDHCTLGPEGPKAAN